MWGVLNGCLGTVVDLSNTLTDDTTVHIGTNNALIGKALLNLVNNIIEDTIPDNRTENVIGNREDKPVLIHLEDIGIEIRGGVCGITKVFITIILRKGEFYLAYNNTFITEGNRALEMKITLHEIEKAITHNIGSEIPSNISIREIIICVVIYGNIVGIPWSTETTVPCIMLTERGKPVEVDPERHGKI